MLFKNLKKIAFFLAALGLLLSASDSPNIHQYKLGPKDLIEIKVFQVPELNTEVRVAEDGTITLPLLGKVYVAGLTRYQVEKKIADLLSRKYIKNPQVTIFIKEYRSNVAMVMGAVKTPGAYEIVGRMNLLQLIAMAGGITSDAQDRVIVFRQTGSVKASIIIPIEELLLTGSTKYNIEIQPGDVINIPEVLNIEVYVFGQVKNPGVVTLPLGSGTTLLQAIAKAGGFTERAKKSSVLIKRRNEKGKEIKMEVNVKDILKGKKPDIKLKPYDIIYVPESLL